MRRTAGVCSGAVTLTLAAAALSSCSAGDGFMSSVTLPASETSTPPSQTLGQAAPVRPAPPPPQSITAPPPSTLTMTDQQRAYLDALVADGVHPSSDLLALSIGSCVCQARAAGQSPQAVWEYVHPLVSSDVHNAHMSSTPADVDNTTGRYISIASERLC